MGRVRDFEAMKQRRLRAAKLFGRGATQAEVARTLGVSRQSAMLWERAWKRAGKKGLEGAGRAGRRPRLTVAQRSQIETALRRGPQAHGYRTELWTLPRIADVIERETGVAYHPGHVWRVLHGLGWSLQKPTTRARERDEQAIAHWVREIWPRVKKTPHADAPPSSSSTRAGSRKDLRSAAPGPRAARRRS
jgi:transposase